MLETYSQNIEVTTGSTIPLNNVSIQKGCTATKTAPATIQLNRCGVYMVSLDASALATAAGDIVIQMTKNGILQPQAITTATGTTTATESMSFETLVQVSENNSCRCCDSPTLIQFVNSGTGVTLSNINVVVTKIC